MIGNEKTIEIPVKEFLRLVKLEARVEIFAERVRESDYPIEREVCAKTLDFKLEED